MNDQIIDDISMDTIKAPSVAALRPLPNGDLVLVMGICSILFCVMYGVVGIACGWIGLHYFKKVKKEYESNPTIYKDDSFRSAKAGKVCSIVGICLSVFLLFCIVGLIIFAINRS